MPDGQLWQYIITQGGWAVVAGLMFLAYRKDVKGTADVLMQVVRENTASNVEMIALLRALHARFDKE
jgi:flagellar motor component MotA